MFQRFKQLPKPVRLLFYSICTVLVYAFLGFIALPWSIMNYAPPAAKDVLNGREVSIEKVEFNPFHLSLSIYDLHVSDPKTLQLAGFDYLHINFQTISVFKGVLTFAELSLIHPYGHVQIGENEQLNFQDLLPAASEASQQKTDQEIEQDSEDPPAILAYKLHIENANLHFEDLTKESPFKADIGPLNINLNNFSTQREKNSPYQLKAQSGGGVIGSILEWEGFVSINPLASKGKLRIEDVNMQKLASYVREQFKFEVQEGLLDLKGEYDFDFSTDEPLLTINNASVNVDKLRIGKKNEEETLLSFPNIDVENIQYSLQDLDVQIQSLSIIDGDYSLRLNKQGEINLQSLFVSEQGDEVIEDSETESESADAPQFTLQLDHLSLKNNAVRVFDLSPKKPMGIDFSHLDLDLKNFNLLDDTRMTLDIKGKLGKGDEKGDLDLSGEMVLFPNTHAKFQIDLKQQPLRHFEPYLREAAKVKVRSGYTDIQGDIELTSVQSTDVQFAGDIAVKNVLLTTDNVREELLAMSVLSLKGLNVDTKKEAILIQQFFLNKPKLWVKLDESGHLNFEKVLVAQQAASSVSNSSKAGQSDSNSSATIKVSQLKLKEAELNYQDNSVDPYFAIGITEFSGVVNGLSTSKNSKADLKLKGNIDHYAPLTFEGQLNPLSDDFFADILLSIQNLNVTSFNTYSGTYVGREINKGKLNLDVAYQVEKQHLQAENSVFVDQFTFGEKVESEQATKLPVRLGVSLLKNQKGEIHIDLPIEGDLNDPDFRYGKLVWKAVGNVIVKAAASPFKLLAGLVDSDDDLSVIAFEASSAELSEESLSKLQSLELALKQRPDLKLDIQACFNQELDSPRFKFEQLQVKLNPDAAQLSDRQYRKRLEKYYVQVKQQKPIYPIYADGMVSEDKRQQDIQYLESQLLELESVSVQVLQALAVERRKAIQQALLSSQEIEPQRLFATAIQEVEAEGSQAACAMTIQ